MIASISLGIDKHTRIESVPSTTFDMIQFTDVRHPGPAISLLVYDLENLDRLIETLTRARTARANLIGAGIKKVANHGA